MTMDMSAWMRRQRKLNSAARLRERLARSAGELEPPPPLPPDSPYEFVAVTDFGGRLITYRAQRKAEQPLRDRDPGVDWGGGYRGPGPGEAPDDMNTRLRRFGEHARGLRARDY